MTDEQQVRRDKLEKLTALGMDPFPKITQRDTLTGEALENFDDWQSSGRVLTLGGRLLTTRVHGGLLFADLVDDSGKLQILLKEDEIGAETFGQFRDLIDPGDFVEARGTLFVTKRGEKTLAVQAWRILSKALSPLPEKWHGLKDVEMRYRQRELDILSNDEIKQRFVARSRMVAAMRHFLDERGFMEVETPILHSVLGGANARPFVTHHNALDADFFLRIATEIHLKRLIIAGFEKVYEIGRCFRNEGIDYAHNPEFTLMELYWAFSGKEKIIGFMEELLAYMVQKTLGKYQVEHERGALDFTPPYPRITFRQAVLEASGVDIDDCRTSESVMQAAAAKGLDVDFSKCIGLGEYYDELFKRTARPKLSGPVWVMDYPVELKPLANRSPDDSTKSSSIQLVVHGAELINAYYYELNNPLEQRERFVEQLKLKEQGSEETQDLDEDFLQAMEHGMPPTSGLGIGIDRLASFLTGSPNLKEIILFPTLRPTKE